VTAPVDHEFGLARDQQTYGASGVAHVQRLKVGVQYQHWPIKIGLHIDRDFTSNLIPAT
jgi:hypothetical protein